MNGNSKEKGVREARRGSGGKELMGGNQVDGKVGRRESGRGIVEKVVHR